MQQIPQTAHLSVSKATMSQFLHRKLTIVLLHQNRQHSSCCFIILILLVSSWRRKWLKDLLILPRSVWNRGDCIALMHSAELCLNSTPYCTEQACRESWTRWCFENSVSSDMENVSMINIFLNVIIRGVNVNNKSFLKKMVRLQWWRWQLLKRRHTFGESSVLS